MSEPHDAFRNRVAETAAGGHLGEGALRAWHAGTLVLVLDHDVDWTDPGCPVVRAESLGSFDDDEVWRAVTATMPGWVNVAVYPVRAGDRVALVLAKQNPRNGAFPEPAIVISGAADGQFLAVESSG